MFRALVQATRVTSFLTMLRHASSQPSWLAALPKDEVFNIPDNLASKVGLNLHRQRNHPVAILKNIVFDMFTAGLTYSHNGTQISTGKFTTFDSLSPVVSTKANFDDVLVPMDHISRNPSDTYYVNKNTILRCHTSAHQVSLLKAGHKAFLCAGDVYRRDSIDMSHSPVFHQMEGVRVLPDGATYDDAGVELKALLEQLVKKLFGPHVTDVRWIDATFPFTHPSWEMEVMYRGKWLELLGCGVVHPKVLENAGPHVAGKAAWAFGLGLERIAMVLFGIPDIRLFWSQDPRFLSQFTDGQVNLFKSYSKMPECTKDISFWVGPKFHYNALCDLVRSVAGDLVETVDLKEEFKHPKTGKTSHLYRIVYRAMDRTLTNEEIDALQAKVRQEAPGQLDVVLR